MRELKAHSLRMRVLDELHARPFAPLSIPARVVHCAFVTDSAAAAADRAALIALCEECGAAPPAADVKHARIALGAVTLRWESHSEFTTYTFEYPGGPALDGRVFGHLADELRWWTERFAPPGPLLVACDLALVSKDFPAVPEELFGTTNIAVAEAVDGAALIATDFKADDRGFVRLLIRDRHLKPEQAGPLVQRILEIETYRTFALLGLPEAQALSPVIRRIEIELPSLLRQMQQSDDLEANHRLLDRLTELAAELEAGAAASLYRFGATRAYDELVGLRLDATGERPVAGFPTWSGFLSRRLNPAMRTCSSTEERQESLSRKLARAAQLLRTRVEVALEQQNRRLLQAMNERARTQLRLQQTVEGLSVAAITYYVASLAHLLFEGAHSGGLHVDPNVATAAVVPFALVGVAWLVRRIRRGHDVD